MIDLTGDDLAILGVQVLDLDGVETLTIPGVDVAQGKPFVAVGASLAAIATGGALDLAYWNHVGSKVAHRAGVQLYLHRDNPDLVAVECITPGQEGRLDVRCSEHDRRVCKLPRQGHTP